MYQDAKIDGKWKSTFRYQDEIHEEIVEIKSRGHSIMGQATVTHGPYHGKIFIASGNFRNLILVGIFHSKNNTDLDRGSFTMLLKKMVRNLKAFARCIMETQTKSIMLATPGKECQPQITKETEIKNY